MTLPALLTPAWMDPQTIIEGAGAAALWIVALIVFAGAVVPQLGRDFFPTIDQGRIRMHVRAPAGTRIEETERIFGEIEAIVREVGLL